MSDYGTTTVVTARELGIKLLRAIPAECVAQASLADIRLSPGNSGTIHIVTLQHFRACGEQGFVLCPSCGKFLRGEQGLWWHQKMVHGSDHTSAKEVAAAQISSMALVPFTGTKMREGGNTNTTPGDGKSAAATDQTSPLTTAAAAASTTTTTTTTTIDANEPPIKKHRTQEPFVVRKALSPGMEAAKTGDLTTLKRLVEVEHWDAQTSVDHVHGSTALLWAAGGGHLNVCQYLVEQCHADPEARQLGRRSFGGRTALHWAARRGHIDVCQWLIERAQVPVDTMTDDGTTPFCWCCWQGHTELARYLVKKGCDPHAINRYGCNVTMWSVQGCANVELLHLLKDLGCSFLLKNSNNHGCMHKAGQRGKQDVVEWLVKEIPNILHVDHFNKDGEGYRPSGLAHVEGHVALTEVLRGIETKLGL